jgi:hypothetical protein
VSQNEEFGVVIVAAADAAAEVRGGDDASGAEAVEAEIAGPVLGIDLEEELVDADVAS